MPRLFGPSLRRLRCAGCVAAFFCFLLLLLSLRRAGAQDLSDFMIPASSCEAPSPEGVVPANVEPGLSDRAVPAIDGASEEQEMRDSGYVPLFRLTRPYYSSLFAVAPPQFLLPSDPVSFRPVTSYEPPIALRPRVYKQELFQVDPWVGISQSYDSNVNLTPTGRISDFYLTPHLGVELQLGSPDSAYADMYDTILAAHLNYEAYEDIFFDHPNLNAFNQKFDFTARIGRSSAIWRPFVYASDTTGTDLLARDLTNRTPRLRLLPGVLGQYQLSDKIGWNQTFSYFDFQHPDKRYINLDVWRTEQEFTCRVSDELKTLIWTEYRTSHPDGGSNASELFAGAGWSGKPDPRVYTELHLGWDFLSVTDPMPGQKQLSGIRFNGYSTFQLGPRFALTFRYDRDYVFNELTRNDNYVSTLLQLKGEFYLGENWFLTPYFGASTDEYEMNGLVTLNWQPEIEISYAFPDAMRSNESRIYLKAGYQRSSIIEGQGQPVEGSRVSIGTTIKF